MCHTHWNNSIYLFLLLKTRSLLATYGVPTLVYKEDLRLHLYSWIYCGFLTKTLADILSFRGLLAVFIAIPFICLLVVVLHSSSYTWCASRCVLNNMHFINNSLSATETVHDSAMLVVKEWSEHLSPSFWHWNLRS